MGLGKWAYGRIPKANRQITSCTILDAKKENGRLKTEEKNLTKLSARGEKFPKTTLLIHALTSASNPAGLIASA